MSEKIAAILQETFEQLQKFLASGKLKCIISDKLQTVSNNDEGAYRYEIPFNDKSAILVFEYFDKDFYGESSYYFSIEKIVPREYGFLYQYLWDKLGSADIEKNLNQCQAN